MTKIPDELIEYLAARSRERTERVTAALEVRTPAERALMKEAAVAGYVLGTRVPQGEEIPQDSAILHEVVAACLAMPDLYPLISGYVPDEDDKDGDQ